VWLEFLILVSRLAETRRQVLHVAPLQRLRRSQVEDGWVDAIGFVVPCYPYFVVFILLDHKSIVVFSLLIEPINRTL
jgi:hypothetical protein